MFGEGMPLRCLALGFVIAAASGAVRAGEFVAAGYGGKAWTGTTDVRLDQAGGTDLTFERVAWDDQSFEPPYYWGARLTWWSNTGSPGNNAGWGAALDFTHAKATADLDQNVHVSGTRAGARVNADEPLRSSFTTLAFTHGLNMLIANAMYRWPSWHAGAFGEIRPHVGAGYGIAWPHVEVGTGGQFIDEYRITGAAYQGIAGLGFKVSKRASIFVEYKLTRSRIHADLPGGGSVRLRPWTQHAVLGAAYTF